MPYFLINKCPVFLTHNRYNILFNEISRDKDADWITSSTISGHKEVEEKNLLISEFLLNEFKKNEKHFLNEWFNFNLLGEEAVNNVFDLLYDYSDYYKNSYLKDLRTDSEKLIDDYNSGSYLNPYGKIFMISYLIKQNNWFNNFANISNKNKIDFLIDIDTVKSIKGNLSDFQIQFVSAIIRFNKNVSVNLFKQ